MKLLLASLGLILGTSGCSPAAQPAARPLPSPAASPRSEYISDRTATSIMWAFTQSDPSADPRSIRPHPDGLMIAGIGQGKIKIDAALYAFNNPSIAQAFMDAQATCSCVRLISDRTQSGGRSQVAVLQKLHNAGIPIKVDAHSGIMHLKLVIVDERTVFEGSFNATTAASTINDEVLVRIDAPLMAREFSVKYDDMWNDSRRFHDWVPPVVPVVPAPEIPNF